MASSIKLFLLLLMLLALSLNISSELLLAANLLFPFKLLVNFALLLLFFEVLSHQALPLLLLLPTSLGFLGLLLHSEEFFPTDFVKVILFLTLLLSNPFLATFMFPSFSLLFLSCFSL